MADTAISAIVLLATFMLSGCAVVPELGIDPRPPADATTDLRSAMKYADSVSDSMHRIQTSHSSLQAGLNLATLTATIVGGKRVVYQRSVESLRPVVVSLAALGGLEYVLSPKASRQLVDQAFFALTCAKHVARTMDDLPIPIEGSPSTSTATVPVSPLARLSPGQPVSPLAPGATPFRVDEVLRAYASALVQSAPAPPAAPGAPLPIPPVTIMAAHVERSATEQARALNDVVVQAKVARARAPEYLVFTTEVVVRILLNALHHGQPSTGDIVSTVQKRSMDSLKEFQNSLVAAQKQTQATMSTLSATRQVSGASSGAAAAGATSPTAGGTTDTPPVDPEGSDKTKEGKTTQQKGETPKQEERPSQAKPAPPSNSPAASGSATGTAAAAQSAVDAVQGADNLLAMIKSISDAATQCQGQK